MTVRSFDIPPLRNRCGFLRVLWVGWQYRHESIYFGEARYFGWRWSASIGPLILFFCPCLP